MAKVDLIINPGTISNLSSELLTEGIIRQVTSADTRSINTNPDDITKGLTCDFKQGSTVGISAPAPGYVGLITFRPYGSGSDFSGGPVWQLAFLSDGQLLKRRSTGSTTWTTWTAV